MFQLVKVGAAAIGCAALATWAYWNRLVFHVKIYCFSTTFTASENHQHICRIVVSLPDDYKVEKLNEPFPKPVSFKIKRDNIPLEGLYVSEVYNYGTRKLVINVYGCLKTVGVYTLIPVFQNEGKIVFDGENQIEFKVEPSRPCTLKVLEVKRKNDIGSQSRDTLYSGGKAQVFMEAKDKFGNVITDDFLRVEVDSEYVMKPVNKFDGNCHVITVDCKKEGHTSLMVTIKMIQRYILTTLTKHVDIEIIQAPLSPTDCIISQSENSAVHAGQKLRIEVQLYDIYDEPFQLREDDPNTHKFQLKVRKVSSFLRKHKYLQEIESLKLVSKSSSNVCQLEWIPMVAGQREYTVYYDGASLGKGAAKVTVKPGPLRSIAIVKTSPKAQEDNTCYTSEESKLSIKGLDEFENEIMVKPEQWCLEGKDDGGSPIDLHQTKSSNGTIVQFTYSFDNKGTYHVNIHNRDQQTDVKVPKPLVIKVSPAPLCHGKCRILHSKERVVQAGQIMKLKLELYDIYDKPFKLDENVLHTNKFSLIEIKLSKSSELYKQEENSLKVLNSGSYVCQLEWIPMVAGQREYTVSHDGTSLGKESAKVTVNPGPLRSIAIVKTSPQAQEDSTFMCYTSEESKLYIKGLDEFENEVIVDPEQWSLAVSGDGGLAVDLNQTKSFNESMLQFSYSFDNKGTYHVNIHNRDQQTNVKVPKPLVVKVSPAPLCHGKCRILQSKERVVQAGKTMTLKLKLYDIYDKPFKLDENDLHTNKFSLIDTKVSKSSELYKQEENSLKLLRSSSNVCQLKWIPMVAGQREYTVYHDGESLDKESAKVTINPGPLRSIAIVNTIPTAQEDNSFMCYTSEESNLSIKGLDEFQNEVRVDPEQWCLEGKGDGGSPIDLNQTRSSNGTILQFTYSFDNKGTYHVNIHNRDQRTDVKVPNPLVVKVSPAPLCHGKCRILQSKERVVQAGKIMKLKLKLYDIYDKPFKLDENDQHKSKFSLIDMKVSKSSELYKQEETSLKLLRSSRNVCKLEWIPMVAGQREYTVYHDGTSLGNGTAKLTVNPGPLRSIAIVNTIPKAKEDNTFTCFTSEESKLSIKGLDEFENEVKVDPEQWCLEGKDDGGSPVDLHQTKSSNESMLQFSYSFDNEGTYHVNIHNKDQQTDVKVPKPLVVKVSQAPLCHGKCSILQSKERVVQAGQIMKLKLKLYDIYNKPFKLDENDLHTNKFSLIDMKVYKPSELYKQEENSMKLSTIGSNVCQLEWIPMVAGQREYILSHDGTSLGKGSAKVIVNPGPLRSIAIVNTIPTAQEDNTFTCYTSEESNLSIKGLDEFKNEVIVDPEQWFLAVSGDGGSPVDVNQTKSFNEPILQFSYSFDNKGTYNVTIQNGNEQSDVMVPESFELKVIPAPLDHSKCTVERMETEKPVFQQSPMPLKLELFNCMSKPFYSSMLDRNALEVKVNGEVSNTIKYNEPNLTDPPNTVYITVDVNTDDNSTNRIVEVYYTSKRLGGSIDIDVTHVLPFSEDDYFDFGETNVNINEVSQKDLIGDDYANIDNINRVLNSYTKIRRKDFDDGFDDLVILDLSEFQESESQIQKIHEMLSLLVEGLHYRTQAYRFNSERGEWKTKSENAYSDANHLESQECSAIKEKYAELMDEAHKQASKAIFKFFNYARTEKEIDLHGQLVANENRLKEYEKQLCKKYNESEVEEKINKAREEMDEAIRHLKSPNVFQEQDGRDWLEIIVGAGHHSRSNVQKIRPKVEQFLKDNGREFKECNKGSLLITYQEYNGKEPCYASFYCKRCDKTWESSSSWKGKWQMCFRCDRKKNESKCFPLKLRSKSTSQRRAYYRSGGYTPFTQEDHRRLCEKCLETGKDCSSL